ncbi:unannotated protein [freshwater metagenome]|uniref:Unannotated protein n=1 Tax=freshwater metagenome TaxID=449393 RepID=A0A6J6U727_9ZZZZ
MLSALTLVMVGVAKRDAGLVRQHLYCTHKIQALFLSQEGNRVARGFAAKAVIEALGRVDREARGFLAMKGAESTPSLPNPLELRVLRDHRDNIG